MAPPQLPPRFQRSPRVPRPAAPPQAEQPQDARTAKAPQDSETTEAPQDPGPAEPPHSPGTTEPPHGLRNKEHPQPPGPTPAPTAQAGTRKRASQSEAEAELLDRYTALVRLAYLTLPPRLTRHRRVLRAHAAAQRALPGKTGLRLPRQRGERTAAGPEASGGAGTADGPSVATADGPNAGLGDGPIAGKPGGPNTEPNAEPSAGQDAGLGDGVRARVLRSVLRLERRPRGWPKAVPPPRALLPGLPVVWGLRVFPRAGGAEEIALAQALSRVPAPVRAAFVLRRVDGLPEDRVERLLGAAGVDAPAAAVRGARRLDDSVSPTAEALLRSREFDACSVQTRPTDLVRRRRRKRLAQTLLASAAVAAVLLLVADPREDSDSTPSSGAALPYGSLAPGSGALDPDRLVRVPSGAWADTSRVDFTAWPARGARADDRELLTRALTAWTAPPRGLRARSVAGTPTEPPTRAPQLLYAGDVPGTGAAQPAASGTPGKKAVEEEGEEPADTAVVLFSDGERLARYREPREGTPDLEISRTDNADVTTAAAVVLTRADGAARYLTAPWIAEAGTRDLLRPETPGRPLGLGPDGVTGWVRGPGAGGAGCPDWPVLQLRSSPRIVEKHAFLLTDLGGLSAAHLTYTPPPGHGPARRPREATGSAALLSWAHSACRLATLRDSGVRAVNTWDFAEQKLPEDAGPAVWTCTRASTWRGPGSLLVQFRTAEGPASRPARLVARTRDTAACSRFGQHIVAGTPWRAPSGQEFYLAAGSREVTRLTVTGGAQAEVRGRTLAVRTGRTGETSGDGTSAPTRRGAEESAPPRVTGRLADGEVLRQVR